MWWNENYVYRRKVSVVAPPEPVPNSHPVTLSMGHVLYTNGKVRDDYEDIEVIYEQDEEEFIQLYRVVEHDDDGIHVTFQIWGDMESDENITDKYHLYYGNLDLVDTTPRLDPLLPSESLFPDEDLYPADDINPWPVSVSHRSSTNSGLGSITYTRPGEHWLEGVSTVRHARANVLLYATAFRIISSIGPDKAIMEVQVDGGEWEDVDLFAHHDEEYKSVFEITDLHPDRIHEIRMRVSGRKNTSALGEEVNLRGIEYMKPVKAFDLGEEVYEQAWSSYVGGSE